MFRTVLLVALVMMLQSHRVTPTAEMAAHFEITERTIYRDIAPLGNSVRGTFVWISSSGVKRAS